ncbi:DUF1566 domain-containing protein [Giesbergeria sinuosa]|uniref:DUF1566 domain-containing protein n=1 Tax=Giesbergeria sinuosa TaxID=80883 RepID=A0ABV9QBG4_9BURK
MRLPQCLCATAALWLALAAPSNAATANTQVDCLFAWAESSAPAWFPSMGAVSGQKDSYNYRYYAGQNAYLAVSSADNHVYYLGPVSNGALYDLGALALWADKADCTASTTYPVVDTGQYKFYGNQAELGSAPASATTAFYGEDAQFAGRQPSYRDNGDGTVSDLQTGLMWVAARGSKVTWEAAVAGASHSRVGGYSDWRMPTIKELYSLIDFNGKSAATDTDSVPYINTRYFEIVFGNATGGRVIDGQDWSATKYVSTTMNGDATVFGVNFIDGRIKGYPQYSPPGSNTGNTLYVRYVRGNSSYGVNQFQNNGDGTVTDVATGLMWAQADSGVAKNWQDALAWVQTQNHANALGYNDWRMPNAKELQSIVDYSRSPETTQSAAISPDLMVTAIRNEGGATDYPWYWASTTHLDSNGAVYVAFGRALGWMKPPGSSSYSLWDVHGAGAQRSDPKSGNVGNYLLGKDAHGQSVYGLGPQGDVVRIANFVRLVRDAK